MILSICDWKFQLFPVATRKYYAQELADHCTCQNCRNFYAAVDKTYPELRGFLERFGVQVEAPDESVAFTSTLCTNYYAVCGSILERGQESIVVSGVTVEPMSEEEAMANTWLSGPVFFLSVGTMSLPWVLEEPMEDPVQPDPGETIQRILSRWITEE